MQIHRKVFVGGKRDAVKTVGKEIMTQIEQTEGEKRKFAGEFALAKVMRTLPALAHVTERSGKSLKIFVCQVQEAGDNRLALDGFFDAQELCINN